jgi:hypothetical protein
MKRTLLRSAIAVFPILTGQAAITYVDATSSNTTGSTYITTGNVYNDNLWSIRTVGSANSDVVGNTVFEAGPLGAGEDVPVLSTLISGLTPGATYELYVFFVTFPATDANQLWRIQSGLTAGTLTQYDRDSAGTIVLPDGSTTTLVDPSNSPVTVPTNRDYRQATLGTAVADGSGNITIFVDAGTGTNAANHRTWYDGVGYLAVPEPAASLLGLVGMTALLRRRRC